MTHFYKLGNSAYTLAEVGQIKTQPVLTDRIRALGDPYDHALATSLLFQFH